VVNTRAVDNGAIGRATKREVGTPPGMGPAKARSFGASPETFDPHADISMSRRTSEQRIRNLLHDDFTTATCNTRGSERHHKFSGNLANMVLDALVVSKSVAITDPNESEDTTSPAGDSSVSPFAFPGWSPSFEQNVAGRIDRDRRATFPSIVLLARRYTKLVPRRPPALLQTTQTEARKA
jgi:hypothetical protein